MHTLVVNKPERKTSL